MSRAPVIGITADFSAGTKAGAASLQEPTIFLYQRYCREVERAGALPVILPPANSASASARYLAPIDGLIVSGGAFDIHPRYYREKPIEGLGMIIQERTKFELALVRGALRRDLPILGICGGAQAINVALGGSLYQDIATQMPQAAEHQLSARREQGGHLVRIQPGTLLAKAIRPAHSRGQHNAPPSNKEPWQRIGRRRHGKRWGRSRAWRACAIVSCSACSGIRKCWRRGAPISAGYFRCSFPPASVNQDAVRTENENSRNR